ncbi:MAG: sensor histidine kinase [Oscillospiraceae bacterium]
MNKTLKSGFVRGFLISALWSSLGLCACILLIQRPPFIMSSMYNMPIFILSSGVSIALFATIMCSAGYYGGSDEVRLNPFDKIPFDVYLFFDFWILMFFLNWLESIAYSLIAIFLCLSAIYFFSIFFFITLSVRIKTHTVFTNTIAYRLLVLLVKILKHLHRQLNYYTKNISIFWKTLLLIAALFSMELVMLALSLPYNTGLYLMYRCFEVGFISLFLFRNLISIDKISKGIEKISGGDTSYKIDDYKMPKTFYEQAQGLNNIGTAVSKAVEQQLKSEKLKTELITNVSHDIKTPLTSIINYVDLMQKEEITQQPLKDYIEVLSRQSMRLKKLIDDLVEASKASTGNITVQLSSTGLGILINQAIAEYTEKSAKSNLDIILTCPEDEVYILADGKIIWRIFDNLLGNICKYSQENTRVYIDLSKHGRKTIITFRNVSKYRLNISSDELMERFVRGDSSRNTEGSGLGLSIARSLTEILHGDMHINIDGDLFKVSLIFDAI